MINQIEIRRKEEKEKTKRLKEKIVNSNLSQTL
jgi:hypothetical protein